MKRLALLALLVFAPHPAAATPSEQLREAVDAYATGLDTRERDARLAYFRRAEALLTALADSGQGTADLHANLANAALQGERLGIAVLHFRRALLLEPDHARAQQNLEHVRSLLPVWVPRPEPAGMLDTFFFWQRTLSAEERGLVAGFAFLLACALVALSLRFASTTPRNLAWIPAAVWLAMLASLAAQSSTNEAVVTAEEVVARAADSALAPLLLPSALPGGTEVRIRERRSPWLRIGLSNGRDVWVPESSTTLVAPEEVEAERPS